MIECGTRSPLLTVEQRWIRACKSYGEMANAFSFADLGSGQSPPGRPRPQGPETRQYPRELRRWCGEAHRFRHRDAVAARTTDARAARNHRRHARLYGARTDRADEPFDRLAQ